MPRLKGTGKGESDRFQIRVPMEMAAFYRRRAHDNGVPVSEFLRQMIEQGILAQNIQEVENQLNEIVAKLESSGTTTQSLPGYLVQAILMSHQLLKQIVEQRDVSEYYRAQDAVREVLKKEA